VSSKKTARRGGERYGDEEVGGGFVAAGSDAAKLLEFGEEVLDQVACFIGLFSMRAAALRFALGRMTACSLVLRHRL
jgi:hypothetical protein